MKKYSTLLPLFLIYFISANAAENTLQRVYTNLEPVAVSGKISINEGTPVELKYIYAHEIDVTSASYIICQNMLINNFARMRATTIILKDCIFSTLLLNAAFIDFDNGHLQTLRLCRAPNGTYISFRNNSTVTTIDHDKRDVVSLYFDKTSQGLYNGAAWQYWPTNQDTQLSQR